MSRLLIDYHWSQSYINLDLVMLVLWNDNRKVAELLHLWLYAISLLMRDYHLLWVEVGNHISLLQSRLMRFMLLWRRDCWLDPEFCEVLVLFNALENLQGLLLDLIQS